MIESLSFLEGLYDISICFSDTMKQFFLVNMVGITVVE